MKKAILIVCLIFCVASPVFAGQFEVQKGTPLWNAVTSTLLNYTGNNVNISGPSGSYTFSMSSWQDNCRSGRLIDQRGNFSPIRICTGPAHTPYQNEAYAVHEQYGRGSYSHQSRRYDTDNRGNVGRRNLDEYRSSNGSYDIMRMDDGDFDQYREREDWRTARHTPQQIRNIDHARRVETKYGMGRVQEQVLRSFTRNLDRGLQRSINELFK